MKIDVEWRYFSGRKPDGTHFHYVEFDKRGFHFRHWSIDGKFYEDMGEMGADFHIKTPQFEYNFKPISDVIEHKIPGRSYITIPRMKDGDTEVWFDHDSVVDVGPNWEWVGFNLDCGMTIMCLWRPEIEKDLNTTLTFNGKTIYVKSILDGRHFLVQDTGMYLMLDDTQLNPPTTRDIVHKPTFGRPYSEWCYDVISKGGIIGKGIREKTFKEV